MKARLQHSLSELAEAIERTLDRLLPPVIADDRGPVPARLAEAMRYAALGGGKRLRPFLVVETARLFGVTGAGPLQAGAALELLHCYSLVHDDLPAMDDDDLRRGRPTVHRAFDEATAILVGDALLTLAFEAVADEATGSDPALRLALVADLARAAGAAGMVGGQALDMANEGRTLPENEIARLQAMKTGALFRHAVTAGALLGRATPDDTAALAHYSAALGAAFQLADDLLDHTGNEAALRKTPARDAVRGKPTLVAARGEAATRTLLARRVAEAEAALERFGDRGAILAETARLVGGRG